MEVGGDVEFAEHGTLLFLVRLHATKDVIEDADGGNDVRAFVEHDARLADSRSLFDNSGATPIVIAFEKQGEARINWLCATRNMTKLPANVLELPLEERAAMVLKAAVEKVIAAHAREGLPIYIWRGGRVVEMSLEELREHSAQNEREDLLHARVN